MRVHLRRWPGAWLIATLVVEVAAVGLSWGLEPAYDTVLLAAQAVATAGAGALILSRYPGHRIGSLFVANAVLGAIAGDLAQGWGLRAAQRGWPVGPFAEWISLLSWLALAPLGVLLFLLFPDGHLGRRGWGALAWVNVAGVVLALPAWAMDPELGDNFIDGRNPYAVPDAPIAALLGVGMPLFLVSMIAVVVPLVQRLRSATGVERLQLRWFVFAAVVATVALPIGVVLWDVTPIVHAVPPLVLTGLAVAAAVAILRYRLYDIDLVISRTVAYGVLTAILATGYAAVVVVLGAAVGRSSAWATAGATLAVAAVFRPLRIRVQDVFDRRFARARVHAVQQLTSFLEQLRTGRALPEDVEGVLRSALGVADLEVRLTLPDSGTSVDLAGRQIDEVGDGAHLWPISHAGTVVGVVTTSADLTERGTLVTQVLDAGALAVEIARLRVELRRQLAEVQASRARIVAAADDERRRMERDLHDGAQQRLVSIGLALRHAQHALGRSGDPEVSRTLDGAVAEITVAIDELRELARGLRPSQLDAGLGPALRELARRSPVPVDVDADGDRFPSDVEMAAYFIACEGLTNAVKHARASRVVLRARRDDARLVISVADDGVGGAVAHVGSGLTGLSDRVAAQGGTLTIDSVHDGGTTLVAELPCAS